MEITLGACVPYYCWVGECQNPATQLVTSDIVDGTLQNCYVGVCVTAQGTDVVDIQHQPLLPVNANSGDFTPGYTVLQACGAPSTPAPLVVPTVFQFPVDNAATVPIVISNSGAQSLLLFLGINSPVAAPAAGAPLNNWASAPTTILVPARGATKVVITLNRAVLTQLYALASENGAYPSVVADPNATTAQGGRIPAPSWVYTYSFGDATQQFVLGLGGTPVSLVLAPPAGTVAPPATTPQAPVYTWWIAGAAFAVFLLALVVSWASDRRVLVLREEGRRILGTEPIRAVTQQAIVKNLDIGELNLGDLGLESL